MTDLVHEKNVQEALDALWRSARRELLEAVADWSEKPTELPVRMGGLRGHSACTLYLDPETGVPTIILEWTDDPMRALRALVNELDHHHTERRGWGLT